MGNRLTQEEIIKRMSKVNVRDYDLSKVVYKSYHHKVKVVCSKHGTFSITPAHFLAGKGCRQCGIDKNADKLRRSEASILKQASERHKGFYDYSGATYKTYHEKIKIRCPEYGDFWQSPAKHLNGKGCPKCANKAVGRKRRDSAIKNKPISFIFCDEGDYMRVPLREGLYAKADIDDYEIVSKFVWSYSGRGEKYATTHRNGSTLKMHRLVMGIESSDLLVDHIFHDTLDNRKSQLRVCTACQNTYNSRPRRNSSSKYKGVSLIKKSGKWYACINLDGKTKSLGVFSTEEEAAIAYDKAAKELHGSFAYLNFPNG